MRKVLKALIFLTAVSCQTVSNLNLEDTFKRNMRFSIDQKAYEGVAMVDKQHSYDFVLYLSKEPDIVKLKTCHREVEFKDPDDKIRYHYVPSHIEKKSPCFVEIIALKDNGQNEWALIGFKNPDETLKAKIACNGKAYPLRGAEICQASAGLRQSISFEREVEYQYSERCSDLITDDKIYFEYEISKDVCQYLFSDGKDYFRLMSFGYQEILIHD